MATTSATLARPHAVLSARARRFWRQGGIELALVLLVILAAWATISATIQRPDRYLPSPLSVALSSGDLLWKGILPNYLGQTLWRLITGSLIGIALGIPFGILVGMNRTVSDMFYPVLNFFQSISGIALLPIVMIWWGTTEKTVFAVIVYTCFFPIAFTVLAGVRSTPLIYVNALRTLGAGRLRIVRDVLVPGAMPSIATGTRLSIGYAWRAAIAGEMLAGRRGLGWMIFSAQQVDHTAQVILGMVLIGCLWILLDRYVLRPIESDTIQRWGLLQR
ncbi:MAG TPA: ABC transporter permease [Methylomirabilota bacterium]|nr:ABC transporter permease [Methylomirabilota bacterium]